MRASHNFHSAVILCLMAALTILWSTGDAEASKYKVLYSFAGGLGDGAHPIADLTLQNGNLYGTTTYGAADGSLGPGTIFRLPLRGKETVLHKFDYGAGYGPQAGLTADPATGDLYGSAAEGGVYNGGILFKRGADGTVAVLHNFNPDTEGNFPRGGLIRDPEGNFYGVASGLGGDNGGIVFKLAKDGSFTVLHTFTGGDGQDPAARLERDKAGNLYGTTFFGGTDNSGTVFKLTPEGALATLHNFTGGSDGGRPAGGLTRDKAGSLYGTTFWGGDANKGVVFRLAPDGAETVLYSFKGGADGAYPETSLLQIGDMLFGVTGSGGGSCDCGTVFSISLNGAETILHRFKGSPGDGAEPYVGLIEGKNGILYGTTADGGPSDDGTIFSIKYK